MKGQPFELACRGGSLLISEARVMRRGSTAWALWRSQITGVGCAFSDAADEATIYLHLRDGRRFAAEEVAPRECFRLFELLGYEPEPEADAAERRDDAPLAIDLGDKHIRVICGAQSVTLDQDSSPLWVVPRDQLLGVRVTAGPAATAVQIVARNGGATLLENVPFAAALRLLVVLGAAPAELAPLAPPDASVGAPAHTPVPGTASPSPEATHATVPPAAPRLIPVQTAETASPLPPPDVSAAAGSAPATADAAGPRDSARERPAASMKARPKQATATAKLAPSASLAAVSRAQRDVPHPPPNSAAPSKPRTASGTRSPGHAKRARAASQVAGATPAAPAAPISSPAEQQPAAPMAPPAPHAPAAIPAASVAAAAAPAGAATAAKPRPRARARTQPPAPEPPAAAAIEAARDTSRGEAPEEETRVPLAPVQRLSVLDPGAGRSTSLTGDTVTVRQAALLLWHAVLVAIALRLAWMGHIVASTIHRLGALRLPRDSHERVAQQAPMQEAARTRVAPGSAVFAAFAVWRTSFTRTAQTAYHQVGSRAAAFGGNVRSAPHAARDRDRAPALPAHALTGDLVARSRARSLPAPRIGRELARRLVTRSRAGMRSLSGVAAARWRQLALVVALAVVALPTAGDALVLRLAPALYSGLAASHQTTVAPGQVEKARPSRAVVPPAAPAGVVYAGSQDGAIYALDAHTGTLVWRYDTGSPVEGGPVVVDSVIYAGEADGSIVALSAATHRELWRYHTDGSVREAPIVANGVIYAGSSDDHLYALRASDGMLLWRFRAGDRFASTPAASGNMVYAGSYDGTLYALRTSDGAEVWHLTTPGEVVVAPMVAGGMVYAGSSDNTIYALDARTGAIRWRYTTGGSIYAAPVVANGVVYVGSYDTNLYALGASDGRLHWYTPTGGLVLALTVASEQTVYVGTADGRLDAVRASDGTQRWSRATKAASAIVPAVADGAVYADAGDSSVFALDAQDGSVRWSYHTNGRIASSPAVVPAS